MGPNNPSLGPMSYLDESDLTTTPIECFQDVKCIGVGAGQVGPVLTRPLFCKKLVGVTIITINTCVLVLQQQHAVLVANSACSRACSFVDASPHFAATVEDILQKQGKLFWLLVYSCTMLGM